MKFDIEATWIHNPTGITESVILPVFCPLMSTSFAREHAADSVSHEWYCDSVDEAATILYHENCLDLEGVNLGDFVDSFFENCSMEWKAIDICLS